MTTDARTYAYDNGLLHDRIILITGASDGIGRALAQRFHRQGARVLVADLDEASAAAVAEEVGGYGFGVDMGNED